MSGTAASADGRSRERDGYPAVQQETALEPALAIVDPHHHLWDRGGHRYLGCEYLDDASGGHRLLATVYVECLASYRQDGPERLRCVGETQAVAGIALDTPAPGGTRLCAGIVARADLALGEAVEEVLDAHAHVADGRFRGLRYASAWDASSAIHAAYPTHAGMLREAAVQAGARCLARRGLSLDAWLYFHQLGDVAALAAACPALAIVVDHCGGPIGIGPYARQREAVFVQWRDAMRRLSQFHNISIKFGGLAMPLAGFAWHRRSVAPSSIELASAWQPYFDLCMELFGPRRCMFESNFPVDRSACSYTVLWNAFKRLAADLSAGERVALCSGTALRIYGL